MPKKNDPVKSDSENRRDFDASRRHFLAAQGYGLSSIALSYLTAHDARAEPDKPILQQKVFDLTPKKPPREPQCKAMISLFMQGGPSHIDLCDRKPEIAKRHMENFPGDIKYDNAAESSAKLWNGPWKWSRHGADRSWWIAGAGNRLLAKRLAAIDLSRDGCASQGASHPQSRCSGAFCGRATATVP